MRTIKHIAGVLIWGVISTSIALAAMKMSGGGVAWNHNDSILHLFWVLGCAAMCAMAYVLGFVFFIIIPTIYVTFLFDNKKRF